MTVSAHPDSRSQIEAFEAHPYAGSPVVESHPSHLAVIARLSGIHTGDAAGDIRCSRVLELGCGDGSNLIAIAESMPESSCVGMDLSPRHIEIGQAEIAALGLKNITLHAADLLRMAPGDPSLGEFDFIIAHGLYSWVPRPVQDRFFEICRRHLSPNGVAYVSYNLLPGWRNMQVIRDFLSFHLRGATSSPERLRKALEGSELLLLLGESATSNQGRFFNTFAREFMSHIEKLGVWRDQAFLHDVISEVNTPVYFSTFVNHAARFGLRYVGDAETRDGVPSNMSGSTLEKLIPHVETPLDLAQYIDFARMRMFRQSLLCKEALQPRPTAQPEDLFALSVSSRLKPKQADLAPQSATEAEFTDESDESLRTDHPLTKAALLILAEQAPLALPFDELCALAWARIAGEGAADGLPSEDKKTLATYLLWAFISDSKLIGLHAHRPPLAGVAEEKPKARGFARRQLLRGEEVTTLYHLNVAIEPLCRKLIPLLDGEHDIPSLVAAIAELGQSAKLELSALGDPTQDRAAFEQALTKEIHEQLAALARLGLLVS